MKKKCKICNKPIRKKDNFCDGCMTSINNKRKILEDVKNKIKALQIIEDGLVKYLEDLDEETNT